ncbi:MAG: tetratricopeptide repeat protein [Phycisphaerae bacterium]|jgi:tetratricopeptide (TPR) repeat protein
MSVILGIIGRGIAIETSSLIWHWFDVSPAVAAALETEKQNPLLQVIELARQQKIEQATEKLRLYLFDNPSCVLGRMTAGALCLQANHPAEAIEQFNSVYMRQPSNTMALYALGYCHERLGNEAQAVEFYQDCLKFKNFLQLPRQRLAAIYFKSGRMDETITEYELLRQEYPDDIFTLIALGHLYIAVKSYERAVDTFNTSILIHPDNFMGPDPRVEQMMREGNLYDALEYVQQHLQEDPNNPELILREADLLAMLGSTAEATAAYELALRICPDLIEATVKLGTQYLQQQQDDFAALRFNQAFEMNDRVVDAYMGLALAQKLSGSPQQAAATLSLAAAIQPNSALLFAQTAALRFRCDHLDYNSDQDENQDLLVVINAHRIELSENPHNPDLHYRLGLLLMSIGDLNEAARAFRQAMELNTTFERARNKLIICLYETGRKKEALDMLQPTAELDLKTLELHYKTAILYCDRIKFAGSIIDMQNFLDKNLTVEHSTDNISIVLQNLGLLDRTVATWENLTDTAARAAYVDPFGPQNAF